MDAVLDVLGVDLVGFLKALEAANGRQRLHARRLESSPTAVRARIVTILGLQGLSSEELERFLTCLQSLHGAFMTVGTLTKLQKASLSSDLPG